MERVLESYTLCPNGEEINRISTRYDHAGNLKKLIKNDGSVLFYTYDALGLKRAVKSSDGTLSYAYRYDKNDNLIQVQDETKGTAVQRTYTPYDEIESETLPSGHVLAYSYDYLGKTSCLTLPDGTKVLHIREGDRLKEIRKEGPLAYSFEFVEYDQHSNPTRMRLPAQAGLLSMDYDLLNRPLSIASTNWKETFQYNKQHLDQSTEQDAFGKTVSSYTYDAKEQLLTEDGVAENAFEFDWQGNIKEHNGQARKFNACNALIKETKHSYDYDLNGNRTSDGVNTYTYDPLNQLVQVKTPTGVYDYVYDGEFLGNNPEVCPQEGFKWRGAGKPGSRGGGYYNDGTKESLRPDFHTPGHKPHWDYSVKNKPEKDARLNTDGTWEWKK